MKAKQSYSRPSVVPINTEKPQARTPYYYLANEVGELKLLVEKLTYRVQQGERRHKALMSQNRALRAKIANLCSNAAAPTKATTPRRNPVVSKPVVTPPHTVEDTPPQEPDYWQALEVLNNSDSS